MVTTVLGIRHHGPGSARSVVRSLRSLKPDIVLVEGPPEATNSLSLLAEKDMVPPVALLIYAPEHLQQAVYYPFAVFSPEWQACCYAIQNTIPVRFIDLPQAHQMAERIESSRIEHSQTDEETPRMPVQSVVKQSTNDGQMSASAFSQDPLSHLAVAAGYTDSERWWEHLVEQRQDNTAL